MARIRSSGTMYGWTLWRNVLCVECPGCAFTFDVDHQNTDRSGYTCPQCETKSTEAV
jgi:CxxC motif-containing protein